ncbi:MAG: hypothetical protein KF901_25715 [Myxococcales bacterium]|nr:hypothetical protein [Myxococcales bacterium]
MRSQIRGSWIVSTRRLIEDVAPAAMGEVARRLPAGKEALLTEALPSDWYPEEVLSGLLDGLNEVVAKRDPARFESLLEQGVAYGISRFYSAMLKLSTPGFVLGRIPTLWNLTRRGPAYVVVERCPEGSLVRYRSFPYFDREPYRLLTRASIRVLLRQTGATRPEVTLVGHTATSLDVLGHHD